MNKTTQEISIEELAVQLSSGTIDRRTFLRRGTMLAVSLPTLAAIVAACSTAPATTAPATTAPASAATGGQSDKPVIAFLLRNKLQSRWDFDEAGFIAEAEKLGVPYATAFTNGDTQEFQNAKAEALLASGTLKALVLVPFGELAIQPILDAAKAKGCKVIAYGNVIPGVDFSLLRDNEKVGQMQAEGAKAFAPTGNYVFSWGAVGNDVGEGKKKGALSVLQPLIDSGAIKVVSEQHTTDWSSTGVQTQVEAAIILANKDIKAVVASWDAGGIGAYAAAKAGVIQFSRVVAVQYAGRGIRVNTVIPGQLYTPMVNVRLAKQRAGGDVEALLKQRQSRIPLPLMGDGRDTANAVLFLASDEARFITGAELVVDGGMSVRCD